jgi:putative ABC transport system permease protein
VSRTMQLRGFLREAVVSVAAQRVFAAVTLLVVAGSTFVILSTAGRSAAAQEAVLGRIDAQGTRTVVAQAKGVQPGLTTQTVDQLSRLESVEAVVGLGSVTDATAAAVPEGPKVGVRIGYGRLEGQPLLQPAQATGARVAWASPASSHVLGLPTGRGTMRLMDGPELVIARSLPVPAFLSGFEPLIVVPADRIVADHPIPLATIVVLARTPQDVDALTGAVRGLLRDVPAEGATIETSSDMAQLREAVGGELTRQSRGIVLGLLGAATAATFLNVWGMVLMRRKDFGRRRALGATRLTIVVLVVTQVLLVAVLGVVFGVAAGNLWLASGGGQQPSLSYTTAVATALVAAAAAAAAVPAGFAARRDPIRELRVP